MYRYMRRNLRKCHEIDEFHAVGFSREGLAPSIITSAGCSFKPANFFTVLVILRDNTPYTSHSFMLAAYTTGSNIDLVRGQE